MIRTLGPVCGAVLAVAVFTTGAVSQQVRELTPEEAVRVGLERNASIRAAAADAEAAEATYREARAERLPSIASQASYTRLSGNIPGVVFRLPGIDSTFTFQGVQLDRLSAELSVEQPIFTGLRLRNRMRAASHDAGAAALRAEQERAAVALDIRRAYWELYRALAVREAVDAAVVHVDEHLSDVRRRLEAGAALTRDLLSAETRRSEILVERVTADNSVRVAELELNRLMGLPLDTPVRPVSEVEVTAPAGPLEVLTSEAVARHPRIGALREEVQSLEAQLSAVRGDRLPDLSFIGRYVYARPNPYFFAQQDRFRPTWELGFTTRWNIWEGGRVSARAAQAQARLESAEARLSEAREHVVVELARKRLEVQRTIDVVEAAVLNVRAAEETFRVARQQFEEGAALAADVLDAEQALWRARSRRAEAMADHAIAQALLLHARGRPQ